MALHDRKNSGMHYIYYYKLTIYVFVCRRPCACVHVAVTCESAERDHTNSNTLIAKSIPVQWLRCSLEDTVEFDFAR